MTETVTRSRSGRCHAKAQRAGPDDGARLQHRGGAPLRRDHLGAPRRRPDQLEDRRDRLRAARRGVPRLLVVNASTIVTTKYFRGAVGTDAREWSLKQLIDRVVKTYRKAGEDHGYFATPADAELFEHELTWLLVHQYFSFNSPGLVQRRHPVAAAGLRLLHPLRRRLDGLDPQLVQGGGLHLQGRLRRRPEPLPHPLLQGAALLRRHRVRPGLLHARRRRLRGHHQVRRRHPPRGQDGRPRRRPPRHRGVRDDQGARGGQDPRAARRRLRHGPRRRTTSPRCSTRTPTTRSASPTSSCAPSRTAPSSACAAARPARSSRPSTPASCSARSAQAAWECADPGLQYDDTINDWHTNPETGRITASNPCSEYMSLDNSSCNLASLNLLKFLKDDDTFDAELFAKAVEVIITAMDISICFADFPTEAIGETTRDYRQLGIGYANLGALLMAMGLGYDSDGGRAMAAAITSLMTGTSYKPLRRARRRRRPVRRLRPQRRRAQAGDAQAPGRQRRGPHVAHRRRPGAQAGHQGVGRRHQSSARATASATRRPRCSRRPGPSAS